MAFAIQKWFDRCTKACDAPTPSTAIYSHVVSLLPPPPTTTIYSCVPLCGDEDIPGEPNSFGYLVTSGYDSEDSRPWTRCTQHIEIKHIL